MSTLTTRIGGYKVVVEPATVEQIQSHADTCNDNGWEQPHYDKAVTARFVAESGDVMDLPFELRSTVMTVNPEVVLDVMAQHFSDLQERVNYDAEGHGLDCNCHSCNVSDTIYYRLNHYLRGNQWRLVQRRTVLFNNRMRKYGNG